MANNDPEMLPTAACKTSSAMFRPLFSPPVRTYVRFLSLKARKTITYPTNQDIPFKLVHVEDAANPDGLPTRLEDVLARIDKSTHLVRLVSHEPPTVKILSHLEDKLAKLQRKAERKAQQRTPDAETKGVRLSWLTSGADFEHKMGIIRKELEKGGVRVDVEFVPKHGVKSPSRFEMHEHLNKIATTFQDISNEWKAKTFGMGGASLYLQSTVKVDKIMPTVEELEEQAKKSLEKRERRTRKT